MQAGRTMIVVAVSWALVGCALKAASDENAATQKRIDAKQVQLAAENDKQAQLRTRTEQLRSDLESRQMTAAQLKTQLDQLGAMNQSLAAQTDALRQQRDQRAHQLADLSRQAQTIDHDTTMPSAEKERQLAALKKKTQDLLALLLKG
jgi:hypothetical protein